MKKSNRVVERLMIRLTSFMGGGSFPAFGLCVMVFYQIFVGIMAFAPPSSGVWGDFVEEFRVRCFSYDPSSGWMRRSAVWVMLLEPVPLEAILYFVWRVPLRELWQTRRRALAPLASSALLVVAFIAVSLLGLGRTRAGSVELPFPAENLRSALPMPSFRLKNQDDEWVSLSDLQGRVVLLTAVYATCTKSCPMILSKIRAVLNELTPGERDELTVVAFSLNPEADTRELRALTASMYGMQSPRFHFVNGLPGDVNALLDRLDVARSRDEETGEIQHSNLFFLLDRGGRIAYRLSLSQNEQSWLTAALRVLLGEKVRE